MELMEPRMLLSADALALAGLPGVDGGEDDAPWEQAAVEVADLTVSAAAGYSGRYAAGAGSLL